MFSLSIHRSIFRVLLVAAVLLAGSILAMTMLRSTFAQDSGVIEYAENGTDPVAVFTAVDPENKGAAVWSLKSLSGDDADNASLFTIDRSSGELSFKKSPNYEAPKGGAMGGSNTYMVTVVARDADGVVEEEEVTIEVTNVEEAGKISFSALAPHPGQELTAELSDSDTVVETSMRWEWSRSRSERGSYPAIEDAEAESYMPTSDDVGYYLRATVSYKDREGDGKSAVGTSANEVKAINSPNAAPVFPDQNPEMDGDQSDTVTLEVGENAEKGDNVGDPVKAEDANPGDILTYTISATTIANVDTDDVSFKIDAATGQITVGANPDLDFEGDDNQDADPSYMVTVTATDPGGDDDTITVTIMVTDDEDEPPTITAPAPAITTTTGVVSDFLELIVVGTEDTEDTREAVTFTADDDDAGDTVTFTWSLSGPDAGDFTIPEADSPESAVGVLTFVKDPNFEKPADADKDNVYVVTVAVTDADNNRGEESVEVRVTNVDEPGTVRLSAVQPRVGVPLTASLTDPDGGVHNISWQWSNEEDGAIDGATSDTYKPTTTDVPHMLTVTATYTDAEGEVNEDGSPKSAPSVATPNVQADTRNKAPKFPDQDPGTDGTQNTEAERTIAEGSGAGTSLNGGPVAATDSNTDDTLTYTLGGADAASFRVLQDDADTTEVDEDGQIVVATGTKLDFETKPTYMVTVIATDSFGVSASINVTINVTDQNEGPVILLGGLPISGRGNIEYEENETDPVAVFTAVDPENKGAAVWSLKSLSGDDADNASLFTIDRSSGELSFKKSPNYEAPKGGAMGGSNTYMVTVVARDADGVVEEEEVTIEVTNVEEAGKISFSALAPHPGQELTAELSDSDTVVETSMRWEWSRSRSERGSYPAIEDAEAESYMPTSDDVGYYLRATVSYKDREGDGKSAVGTSANEVKAINSPNAAPVFPDQNPEMDGDQSDTVTLEVGENAEKGDNVGAPVKAEDANPGDILTYTISATTIANVDTDDVSFKIDAATGQITVGANPDLDFEGDDNQDADPSYMVTVTATDPGGDDDTITVTIMVTDDEDEPPTITAPAPAITTTTGVVSDFLELIVVGTEDTEDTREAVTFTADDDDAGDTVTFTWSLSGPDAGDFTIPEADSPESAVGVLTFVKDPNFEKPADADKDNVYVVTVAVTDADNNRGEESVEVRVTNVDEPGTVRLSAVQPRVGVPLTASLTDPDGGVHNISWQWSNEEDGAIDGATSDTYKPTTTDVPHMLTVTATYTDAEGEVNEDGSPKSAPSVATPNVQADTRNKAPKFPDQDPGTDGTQNTEAERTIAEGSGAGTSLNGGPVAATDSNTDDTLTYTLGGADAASFRVLQDDADTTEVDEDGQIVVATGTKLDFETKPTYMVTVIATDSFGVSASINVTINVTDQNEGPVITRGGLAIAGPAGVSYAEDRRDAVATYSATGPESANASWTLSGDDAGDFEISSSGEFTFRSGPDFESPADADGDNEYLVTVEADDGTYTATRNVVVTVTDVEDDAPPVIGGTLLDKFDTNPQNGQIDKGEVVDAIIAFVTPGVSDKPSKKDIVDLIVHFVTTPR